MENKENTNKAKEFLNEDKSHISKIDESLIDENLIDIDSTNATSININNLNDAKHDKNSKQISNIHESTQKEIDKRKVALSKALRNNIKRRLLAQQQKD